MALIADLPERVTDRVKAKKTLLALRATDRNVVIQPNYKLVTTLDELTLVADAIKASRVCSIDVETRGKIWYNPRCKIVAVNVYAPHNNTAYFIPTRMVHAMRNFEDYEVADALAEVLCDPGIRKINHAIKFDMHFIREQFGIEMEGIDYDTMIASVILNENEDHDLEALCAKYLKTKGWKASHAAPFETWPLKVATQYGCKDVELAYRLYEFQMSYLTQSKHKKLHDLIFDVEMPAMLRAYEAERRGVHFDQPYFDREVLPIIKENKESAQARIFALTGEINLAVPDQLASALFDMLGLPRINGNHTDVAVLSTLKTDFPIAKDILEYRKWSTIDNMFGKKLPKHTFNGKIHTSFNTVGTDTGRWSSRFPNLQQLPKRIGPLIRRAIIPSSGCVFVSMDFSQIELRLLAHFANDPKLIEAFVQGLDIHLKVMHDMLGVSYEEYEADPNRVDLVAKRVLAKTINFGILYGMGPTKLGWTTGRTVEQAKAVIALYFATYPGIKRFINNTHTFVGRNGYVETLLGRKRRLPAAMKSQDKALIAMCEREAVNSIIQGSAADLAKLALLRQDEQIKANMWPYQFLLQIHDEFIYEVPEKWLSHNQHTMHELSRTMENALPLNVPVVVEPEILKRWGDKVNLRDDLDLEEEEVA